MKFSDALQRMIAWFIGGLTGAPKPTKGRPPERQWWRWEPRAPQEQPVDTQYNRAARWLRNQAHHGCPPPAHIARQIRAQRAHLVRAGLL